MKDLYYLIVRDGHNDSEPFLSGPFKTSKAAREFGEEEHGNDCIFTVISLNEEGESSQINYFNGSNAAFKWN